LLAYVVTLNLFQGSIL